MRKDCPHCHYPVIEKGYTRREMEQALMNMANLVNVRWSKDGESPRSQIFCHAEIRFNFNIRVSDEFARSIDGRHQAEETVRNCISAALVASLCKVADASDPFGGAG